MKKWMTLFCALALALGVTGCSDSQNETSTSTANEASSSSILNIADTQCPTSLDPAQSWDSWYTSRWGITETLYVLDQDLNPQPLLATSCEALDDTTWVVTLRDGVTFHNGNPLTAESVKLCWERTAEVNPRFSELLPIESLLADGQTLTIETKQPVPAMLNTLCEPLTCVIDVTSSQDFASSPQGTGPFIPVSYTVGTQAEVKAYADYWGGTPKSDGAIIRIITDTNTLAMAQQSQEVDVSVSMAPSSLSLFEDESLYCVDGVPGSRGQIVFFNFDTPALQNLAVRQALCMSVDKENYAAILNKGASVPATGLYPDFMAYGAESGYQYDMEGAKVLLDENDIVDTDGDGIRELNGEPISLRLLTYQTKAELPIFCNEMASSAKQLGIELKVEVYESVTEQEKTGDFDLMMISYAMVPTGDPQYFASLAFRTGGSSNYGHYSNPAVDDLIAQLETETDSEARIALTKEIQDLVMEDAGFLVIGHSKYYYVMNANVTGLHTNPSEYYLLNAEIARNEE